MKTLSYALLITGLFIFLGLTKTSGETADWNRTIGSGPPNDIESYTLDLQGKIDGEYRLWETTNSVRAAATFTHGILNGPYRKYKQNQLIAEGAYSDGYKSGEWRYYTFAHSTSILARTEVFTKSGTPSGIWKWFDRTGQKISNEVNLESESFSVSVGIPVPNWIVSGSFRTGEFNGKIEGPYRYAATYAKGKLHGSRVIEFGPLTISESWENGVRQGVWTVMDNSKSNAIHTALYDRNKLLKTSSTVSFKCRRLNGSRFDLPFVEHEEGMVSLLWIAGFNASSEPIYPFVRHGITNLPAHSVERPTGLIDFRAIYASTANADSAEEYFDIHEYDAVPPLKRRQGPATCVFR